MLPWVRNKTKVPIVSLLFSTVLDVTTQDVSGAHILISWGSSHTFIVQLAGSYE